MSFRIVEILVQNGKRGKNSPEEKEPEQKLRSRHISDSDNHRKELLWPEYPRLHVFVVTEVLKCVLFGILYISVHISCGCVPIDLTCHDTCHVTLLINLSVSSNQNLMSALNICIEAIMVTTMEQVCLLQVEISPYSIN